MKISYTLETNDLLAFYKQGLKKNSFIFKNYIFIIGVIIALLLTYFNRNANLKNASDVTQLLTHTNNYWFAAAISFVFVIICIFLVRMIIIAFFKFQLTKKVQFQGNRELELLNDRVIFSSQNSKTEYLFKVIENIEENRDYYFIYTSSVSAVIVPKKAIGSDDFIKQMSVKTNLKVFGFKPIK